MKRWLKSSNSVYFGVFFLVCVISAAIGSTWLGMHYRIESHEKAHLAAYHAEGIEAERASYTTVRSARYTISGLKAGYRREAEILRNWFLLFGFGSILFGLYTGIKPIVGILGVPAAATFVLREEMYGYAPDLLQIEAMTGTRATLIAGQILSPTIVSGAFVIIIALLFLWIGRPSNSQPDVDVYEALKPSSPSTVDRIDETMPNQNDP